MLTIVGKVKVDYLEETTGTVRRFVAYLASKANRIGNRCSLGFYSKETMEQITKDFFDAEQADAAQIDEVNTWLDGLSSSEYGYLTLTFNW